MDDGQGRLTPSPRMPNQPHQEETHEHGSPIAMNDQPHQEFRVSMGPRFNFAGVDNCWFNGVCQPMFHGWRPPLLDGPRHCGVRAFRPWCGNGAFQFPRPCRPWRSPPPWIRQIRRPPAPQPSRWGCQPGQQSRQKSSEGEVPAQTPGAPSLSTKSVPVEMASKALLHAPSKPPARTTVKAMVPVPNRVSLQTASTAPERKTNVAPLQAPSMELRQMPPNSPTKTSHQTPSEPTPSPRKSPKARAQKCASKAPSRCSLKTLQPVASAELQATPSKPPPEASSNAPQRTSSKTSPQVLSKTSQQLTSSKVSSHTSSKVPSHTSLKSPSRTSLRSPSQTSSKQTSSKAPSRTSSTVSSKASSKAPSRTSSTVPLQTSSKTPSQISSTVPSQTLSKAPSHTSSMVPSQTSSKPPSRRHSDSLTQKSPKTSSKTPSKTSHMLSKPPVQPLLKTSLQTSAKTSRHTQAMPSRRTSSKGSSHYSSAKPSSKTPHLASPKAPPHKLSNVSTQTTRDWPRVEATMTWTTSQQASLQATHQAMLNTSRETSQTGSQQEPTVAFLQKSPNKLLLTPTETRKQASPIELQALLPRAALPKLAKASLHGASSRPSSRRISSDSSSSRQLLKPSSSARKRKRTLSLEEAEPTSEVSVVVSTTLRLDGLCSMSEGYQTCGKRPSQQRHEECFSRNEEKAVTHKEVSYALNLNKVGARNAEKSPDYATIMGREAWLADGSSRTLVPPRTAVKEDPSKVQSIPTEVLSPDTIEDANFEQPLRSPGEMSVSSTTDAPDLEGNSLVTSRACAHLDTVSAAVRYADQRGHVRQTCSRCELACDLAADSDAREAEIMNRSTTVNHWLNSVIADQRAPVENDQETASVSSTGNVAVDRADDEDDDLIVVYENYPHSQGAVGAECMQNGSVADHRPQGPPVIAEDVDNKLLELHTYTACCVLDMCADSEAKRELLRLYVDGSRTDDRETYSDRVRHIVSTAVENKRIFWKSASTVLRKLARIRWVAQFQEPGASSASFNILQIKDELARSATPQHDDH